MVHKTNIWIFILLAFWGSIPFGLAQRHVEKEKISAMKMGFLTKEMNLTVEEAEKFWPLYHQHQKKKEALFQEKRQLMHEIKSKMGQVSQKELDEFIQKKLALKEKEIQLERDFYNQIKKVLPPEKVLSYYRAEAKFKHFVMERLREGAGEHHPHPHHWETE